ncbi:MAG: bifunctional phosphopantothenoylcysteine decarboxylase/phosphopantothenate--cysteine ligase CoaBC [Alphaproteobacteria bacterium]
MIAHKRILLIISGGIAAYKSLELIRLLRKAGACVTCVLTKGGAQFITPLSVAALSENKVYDDLWSLSDETEMGHIRLSRENDLVVVAPASANLLAQMTCGLAQDLASTLLLASDKPIIVAPAMNPLMWHHDATQANCDVLEKRGIQFIGPDLGETACGETGAGRMSEPEDIFQAIADFFSEKLLKGKSALVTAGPTYEALDPVRFIGNRSSGKQGYAIARALKDAGADVTLVSGPTQHPAINGVHIIHIESAREMLEACENALPVDLCICSAAVSDWRAKEINTHKIKKEAGAPPPAMHFTENPDILSIISTHVDKRPSLVIGFAAETRDVQTNARRKLESKGCDWILANLVGRGDDGEEKAFGLDENQIYLLTRTDESPEPWERMSKIDVARRLVCRISDYFKSQDIS